MSPGDHSWGEILKGLRCSHGEAFCHGPAPKFEHQTSYSIPMGSGIPRT